jgi:hypothetical protein
LSNIFQATGDFAAMRHTVPVGVPFPSILGFTKCEIAPGLEFRIYNDADQQLLEDVNRTWSSMIAAMGTVPKSRFSHALIIEEQVYGRHVENHIPNELNDPLILVFAD